MAGMPVPARLRELPAQPGTLRKSASRTSIETADVVLGPGAAAGGEGRSRRRFRSLFRGLRKKESSGGGGGDTSPTLSIRSSMSTASWAGVGGGSWATRLEASLANARRPPSLVPGTRFAAAQPGPREGKASKGGRPQSPLPGLESLWERMRWADFTLSLTLSQSIINVGI